MTAQEVVPVHLMRPGIRWVQLFDPNARSEKVTEKYLLTRMLVMIGFKSLAIKKKKQTSQSVTHEINANNESTNSFDIGSDTSYSFDTVRTASESENEEIKKDDDDDEKKKREDGDEEVIERNRVIECVKQQQRLAISKKQNEFTNNQVADSQTAIQHGLIVRRNHILKKDSSTSSSSSFSSFSFLLCISLPTSNNLSASSKTTISTLFKRMHFF